MRRRGFFLRLSSTVLLFAFATANCSSAQSVIQRPECAGIVHGIVSDHNGHPVTGIMVKAWPLGVNLGAMLPTAKTGLDGEYRFEKVCPGRYTVLPEDKKAGYPSSSPYLFAFLYGRPVAEVTLTSQNAHAELLILLPPKPGRMTVHITDRTTQAEILDFTVEMKVPGQRLSSEMKYIFHPETKNHVIEVPPDKGFTVHVTARGFREWGESVRGRKLVRVPSGTEAALEAQLEHE